MENSNKIISPHLNAEVYRTNTTNTSTQSYLDYIRIFTDGTALVGCSELTGRYWNGGASVLKRKAEGQIYTNVKKKHISLTNGTADGCFIDSYNKVVLCEDSGAVSVWSCNDDAWHQWTEQLSAAEHDDAALAVDCLDPSRQYVTVGADGNVKVWDIFDMVCVRNYIAAHSRAIHGLSIRQNSSTSFATGSLDQYISLWDENVVKPVCDIKNKNCGVRCLEWINENQLVFGDEAGMLGFIDVRNPQEIVQLTELPAAIHRIIIQPVSEKLAICCDNKTVTVGLLNNDPKFQVLYSDNNMHSNNVRGMAWDVDEENVLHTVGWDGEMKNHNVTTKLE